MFREYDNGNAYMALFDSMEAFSDYMSTTPFYNPNSTDTIYNRIDEAHWQGMISTEAYACLEDSRKAMQFIPSSLRKVITATRKKAHGKNEGYILSYGMQGFMPCVPRVIAGHPVNMYTLKKVEKQKQVVRLFLNLACPYHVKARDFTRATMGALNAVAELYNEGMAFELYVGEIAEFSARQEAILAIKALSSMQVFSVSKLAFAFNPFFFRYCILDFQAKANKHPKEYGKGRVTSESKYLSEWLKGDAIILTPADYVKNKDMASISDRMKERIKREMKGR